MDGTLCKEVEWIRPAKFKKGQTMDGQVTSPLHPLRLPHRTFHRFFSCVLVIATSGFLLPATLHGQAMGKAQVEAIAAAHLTPVSLAAPTTVAATPMLVALADSKNPKLDEPAKSIPAAAAKNDLAEPLRTSPAIPAPAADLAPATQPTPTPVRPSHLPAITTTRSRH